MKKFTAVAKAVFASPRVRVDLFDIVKVVAGIVAAKYGFKLA